jgi:hypothetical protein
MFRGSEVQGFEVAEVRRSGFGFRGPQFLASEVPTVRAFKVPKFKVPRVEA